MWISNWGAGQDDAQRRDFYGIPRKTVGKKAAGEKEANEEAVAPVEPDSSIEIHDDSSGSGRSSESPRK